MTRDVTYESLEVEAGALGGGGDGVTLELDHVTARKVSLRIGTGTSATVTSSAIDSSTIIIDGGEARFEDTDIRDAIDTHFVLVGQAGAHGIVVESGRVTLSDCEITGSGADAIHLSADAADGSTIHGCNLVDNGGFGVNNLSAFTVDANDNWWGDPAGPDGPGGDGVSGDVSVDPIRTSPVRR